MQFGFWLEKAVIFWDSSKDPPSWETRESHQPVWTAVVKGNQKLNEQLGEVRESHIKEMGRDIENVSDYFISRQKPSTHGICWSNRFLMPGNTFIILSFHWDSSLPCNFLERGYGSNDSWPC